MVANMSIIVRPACEKDLDAITAVCIEGFPLDPQYDYRFRHRLQYPDDHLKYTRMAYDDMLQDEAHYKLMVAEMVGIGDSDQSEIMSLSVWRLPGGKPPADNPKCLLLRPYLPRPWNIDSFFNVLAHESCRCRPPRYRPRSSKGFP